MATSTTDSEDARLASLEERCREQAARFRSKQPPEGFEPFPKIPVGRYRDPGLFQLELEHVWRKSWCYAAHAGELPEIGSFLRWKRFGASLVLIRGKDGVIRAFHNSCPHRGASVVMEESGRKGGLLVCPYHAWSFDDRGALKGVPAEHEFGRIDRERNCLKQARCETVGNLVFVNLDPAAKPMGQALGESLLAEFAHYANAGSIDLIGKTYTEVPVNWKIAVASFIETYHVPTVHAQSFPFYKTEAGGTHLSLCYPGGHSRLYPAMEFSAKLGEAVGGADQTGPEGRPASAHPRMYGTYNFFPNFQSSLSDGTWISVNPWPLGPERTMYEVVFLGDRSRVSEEFIAGWRTRIEQVVEEDFVILRNYGDSLGSSAIDGIQLGLQEACIYHFEQSIDAAIGPDRIDPALRIVPRAMPLETI